MRGRSSSSGAASAPRAGCCCRRWREAALYRCLHRRRPQWREAALCRCLYRRRRRWRAAALRQVSGTECRGCRCCGVAKPSQAITHNRHRACWAQGAQRSPPTRIGWVHAAQRAACTQPCARPLRSSGRCPSRHTSPQELLVHAVEACRSCCCEFHVHLDCPTCFGASCYS